MTYFPGMYQFPQNGYITVKGREGANAYPMLPNSSLPLFDETAPIVWAAQTDSAGIKTLTAYDITLHKEPEEKREAIVSDIEKRLERLEEMIREKSNSANKRHAESDHAEGTANQTDGRYDEKLKQSTSDGQRHDAE